MIISFFCSFAYYTDSPLFEFDFFEIIENNVRKYNDLGGVYLTVDLNARTGNKQDYVENIKLDRFIDIPEIACINHTCGWKMTKR